MPFQSKAQQGYMFAKHPEIAERWAHETPDIKHLPMHKKKKKTHKDALIEKLGGGK